MVAAPIEIEIDYRRKNGQQISVEGYLKRFPQLGDDPTSPIRLQQTHQEFRGESPSLSETAAYRPAERADSDDAQRQSVGGTDFRSVTDDSTLLVAGDGHRRPNLPAAGPNNLERIGDYELLNEIASGGMGVVYKARHVQLGRLAALKLIKSGALAGEDEVRRFQLEAQAVAQLDHPGIVAVYETGQHRGRNYMVMAYIDGQSLWQRVKDGPLPPQDAAAIMRQVAEAIQYAHDRGIIHRDLKPQNILLTADGAPKVTEQSLIVSDAIPPVNPLMRTDAASRPAAV